MNTDGYILIYDFAISDQMKYNDTYSTWWHNQYLKAFPKPFRNETVWTEKDVEQYGFSMIKQMELEMEYAFDLESFIQFMMIQSNVNTKIEGAGKRIEEVHDWFESTLNPIFGNSKQLLVFKGYSWYLTVNT